MALLYLRIMHNKERKRGKGRKRGKRKGDAEYIVMIMDDKSNVNFYQPLLYVPEDNA